MSRNLSFAFCAFVNTVPTPLAYMRAMFFKMLHQMSAFHVKIITSRQAKVKLAGLRRDESHCSAGVGQRTKKEANVV